MTTHDATATQSDPTECVCSHPRSDHGDGVAHTACCGWIEVPAPANPFGRDTTDVQCECNEFEARR